MIFFTFITWIILGNTKIKTFNWSSKAKKIKKRQKSNNFHKFAFRI